MNCPCIERIKQHDFKACCPEHQVVMDHFKKKLETIVRELTHKTIVKLAREIVDDELVLSEEIITE